MYTRVDPIREFQQHGLSSRILSYADRAGEEIPTGEPGQKS